MKIDIKKMCSELGLSYKITGSIEYGFIGGVHILADNGYRVYYFTKAKIITRGEKFVGFNDLCSYDNKKCNYIEIKDILSKVIVEYKKLQIELRKEKLKEDFV